MPKFEMDSILKTMQEPDKIRNISVIAHVDHGKSTLTDSLITEAGLMSSKHTGSQTKGRMTDDNEIEKERGITIQSTAVTLHYDIEEETINEMNENINNENSEKKENTENTTKTSILVNLIDSPGHVDFNSEVTSALRVTDGAMVVIDCLEGVCVQTETVLIQALNEKIKPILFLNKLDRIFLETKPELEDAYITLKESVESVDVICQTYKSDETEDKFDVELSPILGNVGFGSGLHAWGFTLKTFATMYSLKFGIKISKLMKILWGNYYYNKKTTKFEKFSKELKKKNNLQRTFVTLILNPIKVLCDTIMDENKKIYEPIIESLRLNITNDELKLIKKPKDYLKLVLKKWLPLGQCLVGMINEFLPSPLEAQKYRVNSIYTGDLNSQEALDIKNCNNKGIMSMYISKLVPEGKSGRFICFGRVFSGSLKSGDPVFIINDSENIKEKKVSKLQLMLAGKTTNLPTCYAGNLCSIVGIDEHISKNCSLSSIKTFNPFKAMTFSVSPVVKYGISCENTKNLPKLLEGLKKLSKIDQILEVKTSKNGENILAGAGELHLDISIDRLKNEFLPKNIKLKISEPIVKICESINSNTICNLKTDKKEINLICGKSSNKHNRLYMSSEPLTIDFINDIENKKIDLNLLNKDIKLFSQNLSKNLKKYNMEKDDILNIWTFGCPPDSIPNILVNKTKGEQYINDAKPHIVNSFMECTSKGVLCNENVRGIKYNLKYVKLHSDRMHKGASQLMPAAKKVFYGCQLASSPKLLEPMYDISIQTTKEYENKLIKSLQNKGGEYCETLYKRGNLIIVKGYLPVLNSFGFTGYIRKETSGRAYPQMSFSHWKPVKGDPLTQNTQANKLLNKIRLRKGMNPNLPKVSDYFDRVN